MECGGKAERRRRLRLEPWLPSHPKALSPLRSASALQKIKPRPTIYQGSSPPKTSQKCPFSKWNRPEPIAK
jgi:hypothetical protein